MGKLAIRTHTIKYLWHTGTVFVGVITVMYSGEYDVCGFNFHHGQANFSACPVWMHT
jgi:hypothetical protein